MIAMRVEGQAVLVRNLDAIPRRLTRKALQRVARAGGWPIQKRMTELAPQAPGKPDLKDAMIVQDLRPGTSLLLHYEVGVAVGPSYAGFYGYFQEFGTVHHAAQPFARPAFDQAAPGESLDAMHVELWAAIGLGLG